MKLLIVTPIFPPRTGGPATYVWELAKRLRKKWDITIICFSPSPNKLPGVKIVAIDERSRRFTRQWQLFKNLLKHMREVESLYVQGPLIVGMASAIAAKIYKKKLIVKFVGDEVWETARLKHETNKVWEDYFYQAPLLRKAQLATQRWVLSMADKVVVPSHYLKLSMKNLYRLSIKKIITISNAVEIERVFPEKRKHLQLVTVSRLVPWKNIDLIINAVNIARKIRSWKLIIIGEGPEEKKLKHLVKKLRANKWVTFTGRQPLKKTLRVIAASQKLILYSDYEGLSHTLIESLLLNTPIIVTDIPSNRETVGKFATFVPLQKVSILAQTINTPIKNDLRAKYFALNHYSWEKHLISLNQLLTSK